jgi:FkbM family methyltransferase
LDDKTHWWDDEREIRAQYWHPGPGQVVVDIGCHIGSYTIPALEAGATVYAVDPCEARLSQLDSFWGGDPERLTCVKKAVAEPGGYPDWFRGFLSVSAYQEFHAPADADFTTLDELTSDYSLTRLDWVKVDVEGAELGVLTGGMETLARFRPTVLIEAHDMIYGWVARLGSEGKCRDLLTGLGYEVQIATYTRSAPRNFLIGHPVSPDSDGK